MSSLQTFLENTFTIFFATRKRRDFETQIVNAFVKRKFETFVSSIDAKTTIWNSIKSNRSTSKFSNSKSSKLSSCSEWVSVLIFIDSFSFWDRNNDSFLSTLKSIFCSRSRLVVNWLMSSLWRFDCRCEKHVSKFDNVVFTTLIRVRVFLSCTKKFLISKEIENITFAIANDIWMSIEFKIESNQIQIWDWKIAYSTNIDFLYICTCSCRTSQTDFWLDDINEKSIEFDFAQFERNECTLELHFDQSSKSLLNERFLIKKRNMSIWMIKASNCCDWWMLFKSTRLMKCKKTICLSKAFVNYDRFIDVMRILSWNIIIVNQNIMMISKFNLRRRNQRRLHRHRTRLNTH